MPPRRSSLAPAVLAVLLAACRPEPGEIRVGLLATFTGPYRDISGQPTRDGAHLAVAEAGTLTIGGRPYRVRLVERDFADRADAATGAARSLINQDSVVALIGPQFSRHAIPVAVVAEDARVLMISPMSSNPEVTADRRYVFRLAFLDDIQADVLARFALGDLGARRAAVLYDITSAYSRGLAEQFRDVFAVGSGRVVAFESYTADRAGAIEPQIRRIAASAPDVLFLPNFADAVRVQVAAAQRAEVRAVLLGSDSWDPLTLPPLAGIDAYVTNQWRPDIPLPSAQRFVRVFEAAYGAPPRATAAMTYDAVHILLDAMRRAGSLDPDAVRAAIAATDGYQGASGIISFGGQADPRRGVAVSRVVDGSLRTARVVPPQ